MFSLNFLLFLLEISIFTTAFSLCSNFSNSTSIFLISSSKFNFTISNICFILFLLLRSALILFIKKAIKTPNTTTNISPI